MKGPNQNIILPKELREGVLTGKTATFTHTEYY